MPDIMPRIALERIAAHRIAIEREYSVVSMVSELSALLDPFCRLKRYPLARQIACLMLREGRVKRAPSPEIVLARQLKAAEFPRDYRRIADYICNDRAASLALPDNRDSETKESQLCRQDTLV